MDRRVLTVIVVVAVIVVGVSLYIGSSRYGWFSPITVENVGGKYNAVIRLGENFAEIEYTDEEGQHAGYFRVEMREGLDWLKTNTPENSVVLCWWDYGHMVKGYAERGSVVRNPSREILESVGDPSKVREFDSHERIMDVATALTTNSSDETLRIMEKYGARYILVCNEDSARAYWIYQIAGLEPRDYVVGQGYDVRFTDAGKQTMIARLMENRDTGFVLIYEDDTMKVYGLAG